MRIGSLSLDRIQVDIRPITDNAPVTINLPTPPGTNNLYVNVSGVGRVASSKYRAWRQAATSTLWTQKRSRFSGPVKITLTLEDTGRRDLDGAGLKAVLDFLVTHAFIVDDRREFVRAIDLRWGDVHGVQVRVEPA